MAERLRLTRTFGTPGWQAWHADGDGFVLAALGVCLLKPGASLALRGLWRLARIWRDAGAIDPAALRIALCLQRAVQVSGVRLRVEVALPARRHARSKTYAFALRGQRRDAGLPAVEDGCAWTVLALAASDRRAFAAMAADLRDAPRGTRLTLDIAARASRAPDTLRADFPLRADALIDGAGWFPLLRATRIDVAGALAQGEGRWTSSTSHS